MHVPTEKPACWTDGATTRRGGYADGWSEGAQPGFRNPFWDQGRACGTAATPQQWADALRHTPTCWGCARARRALALRACAQC